MSYAGESNAKKLARFHFWQKAFAGHVQTTMHGQPKALVLAGPEGADIRVINEAWYGEHDVLGTVGIDVDPRALETSAELVPGPKYLEGPVEQLCRDKKLRRGFDAVFLDYCGFLSEKMLEHFVRVVAFTARDNAVVGIGCMYGREQGDTYQEIKKHEANVEQQIRKTAAGIGVTSPRVLKSPQASLVRINYIHTEVGKRFRQRGFVHSLNPIIAVYRSGRRNEKGHSVGVPMIYIGWQVRRISSVGPLPRRKWEKERRRLCDECGREYAQEGLTPRIAYIGDDPDGIQLGMIALILFRLHDSVCAANLLNMTEREVDELVLREWGDRARAILSSRTDEELNCAREEVGRHLRSCLVEYREVTSRKDDSEVYRFELIDIINPYEIRCGDDYDVLGLVKHDVATIARRWGSGVVAERLGVKRQQIAAWVAHDTMRLEKAKALHAREESEEAGLAQCSA